MLLTYLVTYFKKPFFFDEVSGCDSTVLSFTLVIINCSISPISDLYCRFNRGTGYVGYYHGCLSLW